MSTLDDNVAATKQVAVSVFSKAISGAIFADVPFLAAPPFSNLVNRLLNYLLTKCVDTVEVAAFILRTDLRVDSEGRDYLNAVIRHQKAVLGTDEQEKINATKNLDDKFDAFVCLRN